LASRAEVVRGRLRARHLIQQAHRNRPGSPIPKQIFQERSKKQIRAAVANQFVEIRAIVKPILQSVQLTHDAGVAAVTNRAGLLVNFGSDSPEWKKIVL
jgi:hypothetical protein